MGKPKAEKVSEFEDDDDDKRETDGLLGKAAVHSNTLSPDDDPQQLLLLKFLMAALGIGYIFPFAALTQPVDYWDWLFPDYSAEFDITFVYLWTNLFFLFLVVFFGGKHPSFRFRIVAGFMGQLIVLLVVPSLNFFSISNETVYFALIMIATGAVAAVTTLLDSVLIGFASMYPSTALAGLQVGIGVSGLIGSTYRIITKLAISEDIALSSVIYFYTGALTIIGCIGAYYWLVSMPISKKYLANSADNKHDRERTAESSRDVGTSERARLLSSSEPSPHLIYGTDVVPTQPREEKKDTINALVEDTLHSRLLLFRKVAFHQSLVFMVYLTSLIMYPGLITEIPAYNFTSLNDSDWWSLILLFIYCVVDTSSRFLVHYRFGLTRDNIHWAVYARLLLFPCLYGCYLGEPSFLRCDFFSVFFTSILAFTNGHLGTICIMMVSESVSEEETPIVGSFTGFALNLGMSLGSTLALAVDKFLLT